MCWKLFWAVIMNEMSGLRRTLILTWEFSIYQFISLRTVDWQAYSSFSNLRRWTIESNPNRFFFLQFPHIFIRSKFAIYIFLCSSKTKLKEQKNSLLGTAIEKHGQITTSSVRVFLK